jgi:hypothetical protein
MTVNYTEPLYYPDKRWQHDKALFELHWQHLYTQPCYNLLSKSIYCLVVT